MSDNWGNVNRAKTEALLAGENLHKALIEVANELQWHHKNCNIAHTTGTVSSIAGGVCCLVSLGLTFATGGAATPLLIGSIATTAAGAGVKIGTSIAENQLTSGQMQRISNLQDILKDRARQLETTIIMYLADVGMTIETARNLPKAWEGGLNKAHYASRVLQCVALLAIILEDAQLAAYAANCCLSLVPSTMKVAVTEGLETAGKVVGLGFAIFGLAVDSVSLVTTIIDMAKGNETELIRQLRAAAETMQRNVDAMNVVKY